MVGAQEGQIVATGEAGARPKILVWDGISMAVLATLKYVLDLDNACGSLRPIGLDL